MQCGAAGQYASHAKTPRLNCLKRGSVSCGLLLRVTWGRSAWAGCWTNPMFLKRLMPRALPVRRTGQERRTSRGRLTFPKRRGRRAHPMGQALRRGRERCSGRRASRPSCFAAGDCCLRIRQRRPCRYRARVLERRGAHGSWSCSSKCSYDVPPEGEAGRCTLPVVSLCMYARSAALLNTSLRGGKIFSHLIAPSPHGEDRSPQACCTRVPPADSARTNDGTICSVVGMPMIRLESAERRPRQHRCVALPKRTVYGGRERAQAGRIAR